MAVVSVNESEKLISHAINNRLHALSIGMSYLETNVSADERTMLRSLKMELRDLQELIEQLKHHNH